MTSTDKPEDALFEQVLMKLGIGHRPTPTGQGLRTVYAAWCRQIPFDNVRKLIHARANDARPFPGSTADDFFRAWLQHGTGGTCWSNAGACHALLQWLGFDAQRGVATMLAAPDIPPNHGTVCVNLDDGQYLVDTSILHAEPIRFEPARASAHAHPAWGVQGDWRDGRFHLDWRPLHKVDGFACRFERFGASAQEFHDLHEQTRGWSPFNFELNARINRGDEVVGLAFGQAVTLHADGSVSQRPVDDRERRRILVEEVGLSEAIVSQLPPDIPTPPPPGSRSAGQ
ncbi:arylamine N-acetyltransferase [Pseudomonas sp. N040]|uniref:arylamine N-acetyltransferase n=1 Tax=Pseudomonas sp. N040 TaxID=2785325 RepID=UPI0018A24CD4|nr:arylamine N-acetyltransferase [Pseudomonas sp. N040]MBF7731260.1 arylamine N-acetyltransferase [Pseudomonas sp. N040]MBW7014903.1 arylamine N-acetyltransferase [Pseudomonas sp. N040]